MVVLPRRTTYQQARQVPNWQSPDSLARCVMPTSLGIRWGRLARRRQSIARPETIDSQAYGQPERQQTSCLPATSLGVDLVLGLGLGSMLSHIPIHSVVALCPALMLAMSAPASLTTGAQSQLIARGGGRIEALPSEIFRQCFYMWRAEDRDSAQDIDRDAKCRSPYPPRRYAETLWLCLAFRQMRR
ncbi:hypothetical protein CDD83_1310 [Cordyceps sp. RAO-2017]|nr:hypothetical protein CDD83_1310 [Cordyceps sp. RAO-2017]